MVSNKLRLSIVLREQLRHSGPFCVVAFDVDEARVYEGEHGATASCSRISRLRDRLTREASAVNGCVHAVAEPVDRFFVLLPTKTRDEACEWGERLVVALRELPITVTAALCMVESAAHVETLQRRVEALLRDGKQTGGDVLVHE